MLFSSLLSGFNAAVEYKGTNNTREISCASTVDQYPNPETLPASEIVTGPTGKAHFIGIKSRHHPAGCCCRLDSCFLSTLPPDPQRRLHVHSSRRGDSRALTSLQICQNIFTGRKEGGGAGPNVWLQLWYCVLKQPEIFSFFLLFFPFLSLWKWGQGLLTGFTCYGVDMTVPRMQTTFSELFRTIMSHWQLHYSAKGEFLI